MLWDRSRGMKKPRAPLCFVMVWNGPLLLLRTRRILAMRSCLLRNANTARRYIATIAGAADMQYADSFVPAADCVGVRYDLVGPLFFTVAPRAILIDWLQWNDRHGCYSDSDNRREFGAPCPTRELRIMAIDQCAAIGDTDHIESIFDILRQLERAATKLEKAGDPLGASQLRERAERMIHQKPVRNGGRNE